MSSTSLTLPSVAGGTLAFTSGGVGYNIQADLVSGALNGSTASAGTTVSLIITQGSTLTYNTPLFIQAIGLNLTTPSVPEFLNVSATSPGIPFFGLTNSPTAWYIAPYHCDASTSNCSSHLYVDFETTGPVLWSSLLLFYTLPTGSPDQISYIVLQDPTLSLAMSPPVFTTRVVGWDAAIMLFKPTDKIFATCSNGCTPASLSDLSAQCIPTSASSSSIHCWTPTNEDVILVSQCNSACPSPSSNTPSSSPSNSPSASGNGAMDPNTIIKYAVIGAGALLLLVILIALLKGAFSKQ